MVDVQRDTGLNAGMSPRFLSCFAVAVLVVCTGCAQNYNITTNSGRVITAHGKPRYDKATGCFVYTDAMGQPQKISAGSVNVIAPSSDKVSTTGFNPTPSR
jgi:hypothetical protein